MPESYPSSPETRCSALETFFSNIDLEHCKGQCQSWRMTPIHTNCGNPGGDQHPLLPLSNAQTSPGTSANNGGPRSSRGRGGARTNPRTTKVPPQKQRPGRRPGTSKYYGVRFRPDLRKWVAEIRVQEWKAVDKKVWLGTFNTECAAARAVDAARKLLKCRKKHGPNLPCRELTAYSKVIPTHLILTDLEASGMFRSTTRFIKHECKRYAASFADDTPNAAELTVPPFFNESSSRAAPERYNFNATGIDIFDLVESEESELSGLIGLAMHDQHIHELEAGLEVDSYSAIATYPGSFELGMSSSPNSPASCVTLEAALQGQETPAVIGWESGDSGCEDGGMMLPTSSEMMPDLMNGLSVMESTLAVVDMDACAASQLWAEDDASLLCSWPVLPQDPCSGPSGYLPELPDAFFGLTSYILQPDSYIAPLDLEPWSIQGAYNPSYGWQ